MKILIVATGVFFKGGIERYTRYQYKALNQSFGDEHVFLASLLGGDDDKKFEEEIEVEYVQGGISVLDKICFVFKCLKLIQEKKIELVICNHLQLSIIGYLGKVLFKAIYVTNVYGLEVWSGMNRMETFALFKSDKLIGDCTFILEYISNNFNYLSSKMELLYDAVDIDRFSPKAKSEELLNKYSIPKDKFALATIGRLERNKGHKLVIQALKDLNQSIIYLIVGGGRMEDELRNLCRSLNVEDRVIFTGRVPEDELVDFYNMADLVVLLSTFDKNEGEGLPLGLIEASACAKAIICGNQDGSQDAISKELPNGLLINPTDLEMLISSVNTYFDDRTLLASHGRNGRTIANEKFEYEIFRGRQETIVNSLIESK